MVPVDLLEARKALCKREGIQEQNCSTRIGSWQASGAAPGTIPGLRAWAEAHELEAVVWTALDPKFGAENRRPNMEEVIEYLRGLRGPTLEHAKQYFERTPRQIDTDYRRHVEAAMGWSCRGSLSP
jgi:hypothetical protein